MSSTTSEARTRRETPRKSQIHTPDDIPEPMDEATAAAFYGTHGFTAEALDQMPVAAEEFRGGFVRTRPVSIRFPEPMLAALKRAAARRGVAYQALIKVWLDERLEKERRASSG